MKKLSYKDTGVDTHKGYEAVAKIQPMLKKTQGAEMLKSPGSFFSLYELPKGYKNPVLVSSTDGVGSKLILAFETGMHETIGIDLVAMCVNDLICSGAKPLFFLDYIAIHTIKPALIQKIMKGIVKGCLESGMALIGGETAELRDMYSPGHYDLAGFALGVVEKKKIIKGSGIQEGDVILALPSSGLHSNGYSLARKVLGRAFYKEMLTPTRIYVKEILGLIKDYEIAGIANITGGGIPEKLSRILPQGLAAEIETDSWELPSIFLKLQKTGKVDTREMYHAFNMGVGICIVAQPTQAHEMLNAPHLKNKMFMIGKVIKGKGVILK